LSKFNTKTPTTKTINRAGGPAYSQSDELALASLLLTSFLKDQHYRSGDQTQKELVDLVHRVDPLYAAQAAVYARNVFGMRSVSHVVAGELTKPLCGLEWAKNFYNKVAFRPDDVTEILSYVSAKPSHAMAKGLRLALERFDDYQISKYKGEKKTVKLVDAVNIVHAHSPSIAKLVDGTLKPAETFETKLSKAGKAENKEEAKAEAWRELLENRKIGYLALVRNLRNIAEQAPDLVETACDLLQDEALVAKSKIFPFQYLTAYQELKKLGERKILSALTRAVDLSCKNVPRFEGKTLVVVDTSISMRGQPEHIASLFAGIMSKAMDADIMTFNYEASWHSYNPDDSTITIAEGLIMSGGGTNLGSIFPKIGTKHYDRIFILSDMQTWMDSHFGTPVKQGFAAYKKVNPEVKLYTFDLQGYGDMQFPERNVSCVAGWSDKAFDVIKQLESGTSLVEQIKKVEL
jgi:60 kDa SS-A/Ro ribonucleoprotein